MATKTTKDANRTGKDDNPDPITGAPGAHPVGVGIGAAAAGAAAGAAGGAIGGPVGAVVGAVAGAVAGGYAGKAGAEAIDPTAEDAYWRENYPKQPYYEQGTAYDDYRPAYQYGWESKTKYPDRTFEEAESDLERGWPKARTTSKLSWQKAKQATMDAWDKVERALPGDADGNGR